MHKVEVLPDRLSACPFVSGCFISETTEWTWLAYLQGWRGFHFGSCRYSKYADKVHTEFYAISRKDRVANKCGTRDKIL
jgi:hypothetical protein